MRVIRAALLPSLVALAAIASQANARAACPKQSPEDVISAVQDMYMAFATSNKSKLHSRLAPTFYAFEGGTRFGREELIALVATQIANGKIYKWNVTQPDVQMSCRLATIAYVNVGAVGDAAGVKPVTWLESATLRFEGDRWEIIFLNSTRAPGNPG